MPKIIDYTSPVDKLAISDIGFSATETRSAKAELDQRNRTSILAALNGSQSGSDPRSSSLALLKQYSTTTSSATQQSILNQLQQVMLSQVPIIPVVEGVDWY